MEVRSPRSALVWHHHRSSVKAYRRQQVGYGEGERFLMAHHPEKFLDGRMLWRGSIYSPLPFVRSLWGTRINAGVWGTAAFPYGPKIDFDITDAIGRKWQCATIQLDYQMPARFDLKYIGADNTEHRPVVIHRAIFGSFERFIALLIEHYAGAFPLWLAPIQAIVLPIVDRHVEYARVGSGHAGGRRAPGRAGRAPGEDWL